MQNIIALFVTRHTSYAFYNDFVNNLKMMKIEEYIFGFLFFSHHPKIQKKDCLFFWVLRKPLNTYKVSKSFNE